MPSAVSVPASEVTILAQPFALSHAEILTWPTSPKEVIPPTEVLNYSGSPSSLFLPVGLQLVVNTTAGAYENVDGTAEVRVDIGSDQSDATVLVRENKILAALSNAGHIIAVTGWMGNLEVISDFVVPIRLRLRNNLQDNAVLVSLRNGEAGNLTGGHVDNYVKGAVLYQRVTDL
jgi:hypothetical protein